LREGIWASRFPVQYIVIYKGVLAPVIIGANNVQRLARVNHSKCTLVTTAS